VKEGKIFFLLGEVLSLLAFAALLLPVGNRFNLIPSAGVNQFVQFLYLVYYFLILLMFYLINYTRKQGRRQGALSTLSLLGMELLFGLFRAVYYWDTMLQLGFSEEVAVKEQFTACLVFTLLSIAGLTLWSVLLYLRRRKQAAGNGDADGGERRNTL